MKRTRIALLCATTILALAPAAEAAPVRIDGSPMDVWTDEFGQLQARFDGGTNGEFFPTTSNAAQAGLVIAVYTGTGEGTTATVFGHPDPSFHGHEGGPFAPVAGPVIGGVGSTLLTVFDAGPLRITQTLGYGGGDEMDLSWQVFNTGTSPVRFRASLAADLFSGSDRGVGFLDAGPTIGGINDHQGAAGSILQASPDSFISGNVGTVYGKLTSPLGAGFDNSIDPAFVDNAIGVQWDDFGKDTPGLGGLGTAGYSATMKFPRFEALTFGEPPDAAGPPTAGKLIRFGTLSPGPGTGTTGQPHTEIVGARYGGRPLAGIPVGYSITGVTNIPFGNVVTNAAGNAPITWTAFAPGTDTLLAGLASGARRSKTVTWTGDVITPPTAPPGGGSPLPGAPTPGGGGTPIPGVPTPTPSAGDPPVRGSRIRIQELSGDVRIQLPPGFQDETVLRSAHGSQRGFVPITSVRTIPIRSIIDAQRGTARLTTAEGARSTQLRQIDAAGGRFQILQSRGARPVAELRLQGGSFSGCPRRGSDAAAQVRQQRRVVRRLSTRTVRKRGRFSTRGRHSSATVRGTSWVTTDRCDGTLTSVRTGTVTVRDLVRAVTVRVRAGRRYLASRTRPRR